MKWNYLQEIADRKRIAVERAKRELPFEELIDMVDNNPMDNGCNSMTDSLQKSPTGIIAEFKRRSPSKGYINKNADTGEVVQSYIDAGAAACSILTEEEFFAGDEGDLFKARSVSKTQPLLRKDFIIDEYQIYEARHWGADAILLIAALISEKECVNFCCMAHILGMEVLLEVHSKEELRYCNSETAMVGVNSRDLTSFKTDTNTLFDMIDRIQGLKYPPVPVAESGIGSPITAAALREAGYQGLLIGEKFMKTPDPGQALSKFTEEMLQCL